MRDLGLIEQDEPFKRLFNQGQILGADGERMSKSRGNVQDPDELVARYGADTVRLFLMFMGPWDQGGPWSPTGHRRRAPVPEPRLDGRARPARPRAGRSATRARCPPARTRRPRGTAIRVRGASDAARRHRGLRGLPLEHDGREADGADQHADALPRHVRGGGCPSGTRRVRLLLLMLAPAAPHITEELWSRRLAAAGRPWSSIHRETLARVRSRRAVVEATARSPSRSTARSATRSWCPQASARSSWTRSCSRATRSWPSSPAGSPMRTIHAGGGKLVNIVVRD